MKWSAKIGFTNRENVKKKAFDTSLPKNKLLLCVHFLKGIVQKEYFGISMVYEYLETTRWDGVHGIDCKQSNDIGYEGVMVRTHKMSK